MKKILIAIISLSLFASCSILKSARTESVKAEKIEEQKNKPVVEAKKPGAGDKVVARWGSTVWAEGKVESIDTDEAKIVWTEDSSPSDVRLKDIFLLPDSGAEASVKPGDYTIVKGNGNWWQEAEIKEVEKGFVKAKFIYSSEIVNLSPEKVLTVTPAVAADIGDAARQQNFLTKAQEHRPAAFADDKPKIGDRVLAAWTTTSWYPGKVKLISGDKATIVWDGGMTPDQLPLDRIAPLPTAEDSKTPAVNDFVLLKPGGGAWIYGQVTSVSGTSVEAKSVDSIREYKAGEFVVLD